MKTFARIFAMACLLIQGSTFAANTVVSSESQICTRDINAWGNASLCQCPAESSYDARLGQCLAGEKETILTQGVLHTDVFAIGGETTGITLETQNGTYELIVKHSERSKLTRGNGLYFEVQGDLVNLPSVELSSRPAIIVENIYWLD